MGTLAREEDEYNDLQACGTEANKRRKCTAWLCGPARYLAKTRMVTSTPLEVTAETLYEAVAQALAAFKSNEWVGQIGCLMVTGTVMLNLFSPMTH